MTTCSHCSCQWRVWLVLSRNDSNPQVKQRFRGRHGENHRVSPPSQPPASPCLTSPSPLPCETGGGFRRVFRKTPCGGCCSTRISVSHTHYTFLKKGDGGAHVCGAHNPFVGLQIRAAHVKVSLQTKSPPIPPRFLQLPPPDLPSSLQPRLGGQSLPVGDNLLITRPAWPRTKTPCGIWGATRAWRSLAHYPLLYWWYKSVYLGTGNSHGIATIQCRVPCRPDPPLFLLPVLSSLAKCRATGCNYFAEMCSGSEAGSYLRIIESCITQLKAQGPRMACNEST